MILCGSDFSPASQIAASCAAAYAQKRNQSLLLVTVLGRDDVASDAAAELRLEAEARQLRRDFGLSVETRVTYGEVHEQLLALSRDSAVELLVVGAKGGSGRLLRLGSVVERLCRAAATPVLIARKADGLTAWNTSTRPLRVLLGSGLGDASRSALSLIAGWADLSLTVAHVAWPFSEHQRLGVTLPMPLDQLRPEVHQQLLEDLGRWVGETTCSGPVELSVTPGWGRIDNHLAQLAREKKADLLVLGSHHRNLTERLWHGSISRNAIHEADCNVLCVPESVGPATVASAPRVVVIPTDFTHLSDRALGVGYSLLGRGGTVHLVHVSGSGDANESDAAKRLRDRIPGDAKSRGLTTELQVLNGETPWRAVWQYANRVSADLICMATRSRDAASSLVLGSQAQELLRHARMPVVLVPPDRED